MLQKHTQKQLTLSNLMELSKYLYICDVTPHFNLTHNCKFCLSFDYRHKNSKTVIVVVVVVVGVLVVIVLVIIIIIQVCNF
jgi:subtilase family serine protease